MDRARVTVATSYQDGVFTLGLREQDGGWVLVFSLPDTSDDQAAFLGMDTYCISTPDGATFYGGIESAKLDGAELELRLAAEAAAALGMPTDLLLRFTDRAEAEAARAGFRRVGVTTTAP